MCEKCEGHTERVDSLTATQVRAWCDKRLIEILESKSGANITYYVMTGHMAGLKKNLRILCKEITRRGYEIWCPLAGYESPIAHR